VYEKKFLHELYNILFSARSFLVHNLFLVGHKLGI